MLKLTRLTIVSALIINLAILQAQAAELRDIGAISVLTDQRLMVPLAELASLYARENMVTVANSFGVSENQEKRIEDGEAADLFITSNATLIQALRLKGMIDIHSIGRIASHKDVHYMAAVVAGENMTPARGFLAFLKTDEARDIMKKNGLSIP